MAEEKVSNKLITAVLAMIIIIAAIVILFVNLPEDENDKQTNDETGQEEEEEQEQEEEEEEPEYILNLTFGDEQKRYTLEELEALEPFSCMSTMIKTGFQDEVVTEGPFEFTGIKMSTLLEEIDNLPENYNISAISSDGWVTEYNLSESQGNVDIYNESGTIINNTGATMMLAYYKDGEYLEEDEGPVRIVFCHDEYYTSSNLWAKMIESIGIIEL